MLDAKALVPGGLCTDRFAAIPLTNQVASLDYAAYMASPEVIRVHSDGRWPVDGFTLADDVELVAKHEADHNDRRAFTFLLLDASQQEAVGCVYLNPLAEYLRRVGADPSVVDGFDPTSAMVTFWLRQDQQDTGLADTVAESVNDWIGNDWPVKTHLFRVRPQERSSCRALDRLPLRRLHLMLPGERRSYRWYQPL